MYSATRTYSRPVGEDPASGPRIRHPIKDTAHTVTAEWEKSGRGARRR